MSNLVSHTFVKGLDINQLREANLEPKKLCFYVCFGPRYLQKLTEAISTSCCLNALTYFGLTSVKTGLNPA